ncbi:hypothetical protein DFH07DRAFT_89874 [Mycena maculata]|uniref:Uncharacterized protein n=1 Tax=Mycena maculata TaxID=230809 RepID=A0AAD7K0J8_9AGAR|nr:hypothetical protein DFH07DRAFT_89874 [Mycena maculata]
MVTLTTRSSRSSNFQRRPRKRYDCVRGWNIPLCFILHDVKSPYLRLLERESVYRLGHRSQSLPFSRLSHLRRHRSLILGDNHILIWGRIAEFRQGDSTCVIGLRPTASFPLFAYDLYINILLTGLFLWPVLRSTHSSARLRRVATRTLVYSLIFCSRCPGRARG